MKLNFSKWYKSIHGYDPLPWQQRMVDQVLATGEWPDALNLPTGTGKTSVIDIAVFLMAAMPDTMPRRIVYTVDRRTIVEQTAGHARRIAEAVNNPTVLVQQVVHDALLARTSSGTPLIVSEMRGNIGRDLSWMRFPDQNAIVISTVMQVGTRILFRGVGISSRMQPIYAGLLGNDCLYLLDEVHITPHFSAMLSHLQEQDHVRNLPYRFAVVNMSATQQTDSASNLFSLDESDHVHALLNKRVHAAKKIIPSKKKLDQVEKLLDATPGTVNGVVVNTVENALTVFNNISEEKYDKHILVGRMREYEKMLAYQSVLEKAASGRVRNTTSKPVVIVATQTIEAGADLDFDNLITESSYYESMVQRFGRLNRRGEINDAVCHVVRPNTGKAGKQLYKSLPKEGLSVAEFISLFDKPEFHAPIPIAPTLNSHTCRVMVQTSPQPRVDISPVEYLYGNKEVIPEVDLVWRSEVDKLDNAHIAQALELMPPIGIEVVRARLQELQDWLQLREVNHVWVQREEIYSYIPIAQIQAFDTVMLSPSLGGLVSGVYAIQMEDGAPLFESDVVEDIADEAYQAAHEFNPLITPIYRLDEESLQRVTSKRLAIFEEDEEGNTRVIYGISSTTFTIASDKSDIATQEADRVVTLAQHSEDVRDVVEQFAKRLGIPEHITASLKDAAYYHDIGKSDIRFQGRLYGSIGDAYIEEHGVLAKSLPGTSFNTSHEYPQGMRHENMSLLLLESSSLDFDDLAKYLIATHHGHNRALMCRVEDNNPVHVSYGEMEAHSSQLGSLSNAIVDRFWQMQDTYGTHGIAYLEAILRLADHRASEGCI